jgi:hypothetical protein
MTRERTVYVERTPLPGWGRAIFWGVIALVCLALVAGWDTSLPPLARVLLACLVGAAGAGLHMVVGGLTVRIEETRVFLHLGSVPVIRRRIPFDEIRSLASVRYRPIVEFGGWGIRGWGKRKAWTARGDRAVALELTRGRQLLIGSDHPQRLEGRIQSAMADRRKLARPSIEADAVEGH